MPQIDLASWSSPSRAVCPLGAQERGLSMAATLGGFAMTRSTTCWHVRRPWRAKTRRSSMTATSKPFRFPPTSTPIHRATSQSMPHPNTPALRADAENVAGPRSHKHGLRYTAAQRRQGTHPSHRQRLRSYKIAGRSARKKRGERSVGGRSGRVDTLRSCIFMQLWPVVSRCHGRCFIKARLA